MRNWYAAKRNFWPFSVGFLLVLVRMVLVFWFSVRRANRFYLYWSPIAVFFSFFHIMSIDRKWKKYLKIVSWSGGMAVFFPTYGVNGLYLSQLVNFWFKLDLLSICRWLNNCFLQLIRKTILKIIYIVPNRFELLKAFCNSCFNRFVS